MFENLWLYTSPNGWAGLKAKSLSHNRLAPLVKLRVDRQKVNLCCAIRYIITQGQSKQNNLGLHTHDKQNKLGLLIHIQPILALSIHYIHNRLFGAMPF